MNKNSETRFQKSWNSFWNCQNCLVPHFLCKDLDGFSTKKACLKIELRKGQNCTFYALKFKYRFRTPPPLVKSIRKWNYVTATRPALPYISCLTRKTLETTNHVFTHKTDEFKPVTNQRSSGRCWIFACLNAARIPFIKVLQANDFDC